MICDDKQRRERYGVMPMFVVCCLLWLFYRSVAIAVALPFPFFSELALMILMRVSGQRRLIWQASRLLPSFTYLVVRKKKKKNYYQAAARACFYTEPDDDNG